MKKVNFLWLISCLILLLIGCKNPIIDLPEDPPVDDTTPGSQLPSITAYTFISEMETSLSSLSALSSADVTTIGTASRTAVGADTADINGYLDNIVEGAVNSLSEISISTVEKQDVIDTILVSVLTSVNIHKAEAMAVRARAIDPNNGALSVMSGWTAM